MTDEFRDFEGSSVPLVSKLAQQTMECCDQPANQLASVSNQPASVANQSASVANQPASVANEPASVMKQPDRDFGLGVFTGELA